MPGPPLATDTILHGVIYLKGETMYPDTMHDAMKEKAKSVQGVQDHPIFKPPDAAPAPPAPPANVLEVPSPASPPPPPVDESLPDDFPYRDEFIAAGYDTVEKVEVLDDLTEVNGIGPTREAEVQTYLAGLHLEPTSVDES